MYCIKGKCKEQCDECKSHFDNGIDHYAGCEDPNNCNCDDLLPCPVCQGYGFISVGYLGETDDCYTCDYGFVTKEEHNRITA